MSMPGTAETPDLTLRDLAQRAEDEARRLAANFGLDLAVDGDHAYFALAQTVKLGEEVGELHAEVLGALEYQRRDKAGRYSSETLGAELADVMVCAWPCSRTSSTSISPGPSAAS
jgi:hypothetical protein